MRPNQLLPENQYAKLRWIALTNALNSWIDLARTSGIELFETLSLRITRHRAGILAAIEYNMSNGRVESVNGRIRLITRVAFGSASPQALTALAMLRLGGARPTLQAANDPRKRQKSPIGRDPVMRTCSSAPLLTAC
jgi:hypothetical protein